MLSPLFTLSTHTIQSTHHSITCLSLASPHIHLEYYICILLRWITPENVNIEQLLNVFISIDPDSPNLVLLRGATRFWWCHHGERSLDICKLCWGNFWFVEHHPHPWKVVIPIRDCDRLQFLMGVAIGVRALYCWHQDYRIDTRIKILTQEL